MPTKLEDGTELPVTKSRGGRFIERWPDFPSWLDGGTWELPYHEIGISGETVHGFRASLRYQAQALGLNLTTKTVRRNWGTPEYYRALLVRAY